MHTEVVSVPKLLVRPIPVRGMLGEPAWTSIPMWVPSVVAVVCPARRFRFSWGSPHVVKSANFVSRVSPDYSNSNCPPKLLEHDWEGAAFPIGVDQW